MSFDNIINKIKDYKSLYNEALTMCNRIRDNATMTDAAKVQKIKDTVARYNPQIDAAAGRVIDAIDNTIAEIEKDRRKAIEKGFAMADQIALAAKGIRSGEYSRTMVSDMIEIYKDNPPMLESIRAAIKDSPTPSVRELYMRVPADKTEEQIKGLSKVKDKIAAAPKLDTQGLAGDWSVDMWKKGISIDGIIDFILGLEDMSAAVIDDVMVEPEPLDAAAAEQIKNIIVNGTAGVLFGEDAGLKLGRL